MLKKILSLLACLLLFMTSGCGSKKEVKTPQTIYVSAAASLTNVMQKLGKDYEEKHPDVKIKFNFAGSGALQAQIEQGAPADLFISASPRQMKALLEKGLIKDGTEKTLLKNGLVLIAPKDSKLHLTEFSQLKEGDVKKIAIGNPQGVPAGQYAAQVFSSLRLEKPLKEKLVLAANVRQVLAWVEEGEASCGIVYATDAKISDKVKVLLTAPENTHQPITYPVAVLKNAKAPQVAKEFEAYLTSKEATSVFEKYGFTPAAR